MAKRPQLQPPTESNLLKFCLGAVLGLCAVMALASGTATGAIAGMVNGGLAYWLIKGYYDDNQQTPKF